MPLSFGLVAGLLAVVAGAILYMATRLKRVAVVLVGIGAAVALLTFAVLVLAASSRM